MEQAKTNFGMRKIFALLVSLIAAFSVAGALNLAPISQQVAFADDNVLVVPSANDLKTIGELTDDEAPVYYLEADKPYESIDFSALGSFGENGMIAVIDGNYYVEHTAVADISSYASSKKSIEDTFTLDSEAIEGLDFSSDVYVFWMLDDDFEYYYLVLKMSEKAADVLPCAVTVEGKEVTSFVKQADGYTYSGMEYDPSNPEADQYGYVYPKKTADLYTVIVPPMATAADLGFDEGRLVYSYSRDGQYISAGMRAISPLTSCIRALRLRP